jgi:hypothetical protein
MWSFGQIAAVRARTRSRDVPDVRDVNESKTAGAKSKRST